MDAKKITRAVIGGIVMLTAAFVIWGGSFLSGPAAKAEDIIINKRDVTGQARFYPYQAGDISMEVLAVSAPDGSMRTAFNTCQVCFSSGRGYYVQEGDELVCQNCGNRFNISDVEVVRGGCNPVPILRENKTEDEEKIVIPKSFLDKNKELFSNWKND